MLVHSYAVASYSPGNPWEFVDLSFFAIHSVHLDVAKTSVVLLMFELFVAEMAVGVDVNFAVLVVSYSDQLFAEFADFEFDSAPNPPLT